VCVCLCLSVFSILKNDKGSGDECTKDLKLHFAFLHFNIFSFLRWARA